MKILKTLLLISFAITALTLTTGCSKKPIPAYSSKAGHNAPEGRELASGKQGTISEETMNGEESLDAGGQNLGSLDVKGGQNSEEYKRAHGRSSIEMQPVYFDFDQASIRDDQIPRLEHNAEYLKSNPAAKLVVEGNTDERGTNEYNLALAERRAINAKTYLVELGIDEARIRTVSYGEERPLFTGHTEDDWAQNRRDDFVLE